MSYPRLEFYEYDIEGYDFQDPSSFKNFRRRHNSDDDSKRIKKKFIQNPPRRDVIYKHLESSIDPIVSLEYTNRNIDYPNNTTQNHTNLIEFLNIYRTVQAKTKMNRSFYSLQRQRRMIQSIEEATRINISYIQNVLTHPYLYNHLNIDEIHVGAFIFKVDARPDEKIICFGDFHGSFHTFLRNIFRLYVLGVLDLSEGKYKINDGYKLIFLGDIVDRGDFGLEIIYIISQFIIQNNTNTHQKIIVNRGNHEEYSTYSKKNRRDPFLTDFRNEYQTKIGNQDIIFKKFFSYLPSAIVLEQNGTRYWMSHGGIPYYDTPTNILNINILFAQVSIAFIQNRGNPKLSIPHQIRWNDFYLGQDTIPNQRRMTAYLIGTEYLLNFLQLNNIQMIIRGHNDSFFNSFMFCQNPIHPIYNRTGSLPSDALDPQIYPLSKVPINPHSPIPPLYQDIVESNPNINHFLHKIPINTFTNQSFNLSNGAVAMIDPSNLNSRMLDIDHYLFYPVITISTNTDYGRYLTRDSFMLLHQISAHNQTNQNYTGLFQKRYIMNKINRTQPLNFTNVIPRGRLVASRASSVSSTSSAMSTPLVSPAGVQMTTLKKSTSFHPIPYPIEIDCRNMDSQIGNFVPDLNPKELLAVKFYLKKGMCFGILKGSRRIVKDSYDSITFYQDSTTKASISMEIYKALIDLTPFISFKIIHKISSKLQSLTRNLASKPLHFKYYLLKIFIEKLPSISKYYKISDIFGRLFRNFININLRNLQNYQIIANVESLMDVYNFICFYLFYYESKSFMKSANFVSNRNQINITNPNNFFNLYLGRLPNFGTNPNQIKESLLGVNTTYIEYLNTILQSL